MQGGVRFRVEMVIANYRIIVGSKGKGHGVEY
jgi:hypothetical protein